MKFVESLPSELWCSRYSFTISSVIFPVLHAQYPTAQKCFPQYCCFSFGNSFCNILELLPFNLLLYHWYLFLEDTQYGCAHDQNLQLLLGFWHPLNHKFESVILDNVIVDLLPILYSDISLTKLCGKLIERSYDTLFATLK